MADDGTDRSRTYRWRLAWAALASYALHMLLFGGLSVSKIDLNSESLEVREPLKPKRPASDFKLEVPRSAATETPAHERPLDVPVTPDEAKPAEPRERSPEKALAERQEKPEEVARPVETSQPALETQRTRDTQAAPLVTESPTRAAEATPEQAAAAAQAEAAAATAEATTAPAAAPAAIAPRERADVGRVAARWKPREVALLERLTARAPDAAALAARRAASTAAAAQAEALDRQTTAAAGATETARIDAVAPATTAAAEASPLAPSAREAPRRELPQAAATTGRASAAASPAVRDAPNVNTGSPGAATSVARTAPRSGGPAPAASARLARQTTEAAPATAGSSTAIDLPTMTAVAGETGGQRTQIAPAEAAAAANARRPSRGESALAAEGGRQATTAPADAGSTAIASRSAGGGRTAAIGDSVRGRSNVSPDGQASSGAGLSPRPIGREAGTIAADAGTAAAAAETAPAATALATSSGGGRGQATEATPAQRLGPALVERSRTTGAGRSALATSRGSVTAAADGEDEGLSVSPADLAALGSEGRRRAGLPDQTAAGPRTPERIAAAALPADGRVRDVSEAFARRGNDGGTRAGGIDDEADLDRARAAVERGLEFLARSQQPDGRWRLDKFAGVTEADVPKLESDTAATGLALLCFFGAGHDHFDGKHRDTVRRGLEFLISVQKPDGDLFLPADDLSNSCCWLYSHGIASIAVCEAVGMTGDKLVMPAAEKACRFISESRHPTLGGWRYMPRTDADLSVSGWMLVALRAGELAGVKTDPAALEGVRTLLAASSSPSDPTRFAYNPRKSDQRQTDLSVTCMTAVGALMRLHTGTSPDDPGVVASAEAIAKIAPSYGTATRKVRDAYLWYYASQVLVHTGGERWQRWYADLVDTLEPEQRKDGPLAGSWDPLGETPDRWGPFGGRLYVTALHLLALEVPWRHLPTFATEASR